ncbi:hypothetical protein EST38_g14338 [Candolleomyces aberdarensis]|uniref:Uncharacterized protein n=1 Tax=Candolleomyces aberdarensis TaxID=2316362 RepID=A0A4Q2CXI9_9AGAR|nr:hypothetical protein EST38_g14338 [Candolleomyces aberdarensis]
MKSTTNASSRRMVVNPWAGVLSQSHYNEPWLNAATNAPESKVQRRHRVITRGNVDEVNASEIPASVLSQMDNPKIQGNVGNGTDLVRDTDRGRWVGEVEPPATGNVVNEPWLNIATNTAEGKAHRRLLIITRGDVDKVLGIPGSIFLQMENPKVQGTVGNNTDLVQDADHGCAVGEVEPPATGNVSNEPWLNTATNAAESGGHRRHPIITWGGVNNAFGVSVSMSSQMAGPEVHGSVGRNTDLAQDADRGREVGEVEPPATGNVVDELWLNLATDTAEGKAHRRQPIITKVDVDEVSRITGSILSQMENREVQGGAGNITDLACEADRGREVGEVEPPAIGNVVDEPWLNLAANTTEGKAHRRLPIITRGGVDEVSGIPGSMLSQTENREVQGSIGNNTDLAQDADHRHEVGEVEPPATGNVIDEMWLNIATNTAEGKTHRRCPVVMRGDEDEVNAFGIPGLMLSEMETSKVQDSVEFRENHALREEQRGQDNDKNQELMEMEESLQFEENGPLLARSAHGDVEYRPRALISAMQVETDQMVRRRRPVMTYNEDLGPVPLMETEESLPQSETNPSILAHDVRQDSDFWPPSLAPSTQVERGQMINRRRRVDACNEDRGYRDGGPWMKSMEFSMDVEHVDKHDAGTLKDLDDWSPATQVEKDQIVSWRRSVDTYNAKDCSDNNYRLKDKGPPVTDYDSD